MIHCVWSTWGTGFKRYGRCTLFEIVFSLVVEGVFWGTGAGLKKLMGRRISDAGTSEAWLGFAFYVFLGVAVAFFFMSVDIFRSN